MPQLTYTNAPAVALAGMLADAPEQCSITSKPASEAIPPGVACVLDSAGTVSLPKGTGALPPNGTGSLVGVSVYLSASPPGSYQIGDMVPMVRKGRIWAHFVGTGATENEAMQICHASDNTNSELANRGFFSDIAASTTAGQEKTLFARGVARDGVGSTLALVEMNLP